MNYKVFFRLQKNQSTQPVSGAAVVTSDVQPSVLLLEKSINKELRRQWEGTTSEEIFRGHIVEVTSILNIGSEPLLFGRAVKQMEQTSQFKVVLDLRSGIVDNDLEEI